MPLKGQGVQEKKHVDQAQDAAAGEKVFMKCKVCHVADKDQNKVGPSLNGVIGRTAGTHAGTLLPVFLTLTNNSSATASSITLNQIVLRTLTGTGAGAIGAGAAATTGSFGLMIEINLSTVTPATVTVVLYFPSSTGTFGSTLRGRRRTTSTAACPQKKLAMRRCVNSAT